MHKIETKIDLLLERTKKDSNLKILGLDIGMKKIGISTGHFATNTILPYKVIKTDLLKNNVKNILSLCIVNNIYDVVIGIPLQNNELTDSAKYIFNFATALAAIRTINIYFQDESFSSCIADELLRETGLSRKKREKINDAVAATVILNNFFIKISNYKTI